MEERGKAEAVRRARYCMRRLKSLGTARRPDISVRVIKSAS